MTIKRPLLAATVEDHTLDSLEYPLIASRKLDGIRVLIHPELGPVTRKFKPVPNEHIRECLSDPVLVGLDGEVMLDKDKSFNSVQSAVMSRDGTPQFMYHVFDDFSAPQKPFIERFYAAQKKSENLMYASMVNHVTVPDTDTLQRLTRMYIEEGYEGIMLRDPKGPYKEGRSTLRQQYLIKFKNFADAEGTIVGFEELLHNDNPQERDELGYAKRSSHKANKVRTGRLGALVLNTDWGELRVGSGFDTALRERIWEQQDLYKGMLVQFKYQQQGMQDRPRFPIFLGFRHPDT